MTAAQAAILAGRSETWLRSHSCAWCDQPLISGLMYGCGAMYGPKCDPTTKDYHSNIKQAERPGERGTR